MKIQILSSLKKWASGLAGGQDRLEPPVVNIPGNDPHPVADLHKREATLDNRPWAAMMEDTAALLCEVDALIPRMQEDQKPLAGHIKDRLFEILERNGAQRIDDETAYDITRHKVVPAARHTQGTPIAKTLEPGLALEEKVIRKATVEIGAKG